MRKKTIKEISEYFKVNGYELISEKYIDAKSKLESMCPNGNIFIISYDKFKGGQRCRCDKCKSPNPRLFSFDYVKSYVESNNYELISRNYLGVHEELLVKCPKGHITSIPFAYFKSGRRCYECCHNRKYTFKEVEEYIESFNYKLLETEYINVNTKLKIVCEKGHVYYSSFHNFKNGKRCMRCKESKGEKRVGEILNKYNIEFDKQYKFDDCKNIFTLPFDFYLPKYNILIEYDGIQHFELRKFYNDTIDDFVKRKINDGLKNEYCYFNHIKLLRIPYWDFDNIEQILIKQLNLDTKLI